jgi:signal transduction histidine kinase
LIGDLLDPAKIDATGSQLDLEEVELAAMGRTAVAAIAPLAAERGHTVHAALGEGASGDVGAVVPCGEAL